MKEVEKLNSNHSLPLELPIRLPYSTWTTFDPSSHPFSLILSPVLLSPGLLSVIVFFPPE